MGRRVATAVAVMFLVLLVIAAPSWAHHKGSHSNGGGKSGNKGKSAASGWTEDNDTNDNGTPNNLPDDGDNAHPSGKDKSVEHGNSGNQGNSTSDPDDDGHGPDRSNGGPDKPNGTGGVDLADQDGNNGCGNDDDFEDDNEGWCGKPKSKVKEKTKEKVKENTKPKDDDTPPEDDDTPPDVDTPINDDNTGNDDVGQDEPEVLGATLSRGPGIDSSVNSTIDRVLEREATAPETEEGALPFTGAGVIGFVIAGAALVLAGLFLFKARLTS